MLFMLVNRTRRGLAPEDFAALGRIAQEFYDNVPPAITLHGDWSANDGSCTFALLETDDHDLLLRVQEPFRAYVDIEVIPVTRVTGWAKR